MRFFEDYGIGAKLVTSGKTVTEADIVFFGAVAGDHDPLHMDAEFCKNTIFKQRIAHGTLGVVVQSGLSHDLGIEGTLISQLVEISFKFRSAIMIGDTVHVEHVVLTKEEIEKSDFGLITMSYKVINQKEEIVQEGVKKLKVRKKNGWNNGQE